MSLTIQQLMKQKAVYTAFNFHFYDQLLPQKVPKGTKETPSKDQLKILIENLFKNNGMTCDSQTVTNLANNCRELKRDWTRDFRRYFDSFPSDYQLHENSSEKESYNKIFQKLGTKTEKAIPDYTKGKINPDNLWTRYAGSALLAIEFNRVFVPILKKEHISSRYRYFVQKQEIGGKEYRAEVYVMRNKMVIISEWQEQCLCLPDRLTLKTISKYLPIVREAIVLFWIMVKPEKYKEALKQVEKWPNFETEGRQRNAGLEQIANAVESIAKRAVK